VALEAVRESILEGALKPGERLVANDLADSLEMSSTPVREALRILEAEGLVTSTPHRGAVVRDLAGIEADTFFALRAPMESLATRLAVAHLTASDIEKLELLQDEMKTALRDEDDSQLTQSNASWHMIIYNACGSPYLIDLIRRLWMPFHWRGQWVDPRRSQSVHEHQEIIDAIRNRRADHAGRLMQEHIERVHQSIVDAQAGEDVRAEAEESTSERPGHVPHRD